MPISPLPGVINQVHYPGVGDVDDCSVISAFWSLVAAGTLDHGALPSVAAFRRAAGVPDAPGPTGMTNAQSLRAVRQLAPQAGAYSFSGDYEAFHSIVGHGAVASVSVDSSKLPATVRYGFPGAHQVGIADVDGQLYIANPLASGGSRPQAISVANFTEAAEGLFEDGKLHAVIFPPPKVDPRDATIATLRGRVALLERKIIAARKALA